MTVGNITDNELKVYDTTPIIILYAKNKEKEPLSNSYKLIPIAFKFYRSDIGARYRICTFNFTVPPISNNNFCYEFSFTKLCKCCILEILIWILKIYGWKPC